MFASRRRSPRLARLLVFLLLAGWLSAPAVRAADREVAWVVAGNESGTERALNMHAARGLRLAAISDGLPCSVAVMQTPAAAASGAAEYRVVSDRALAAEVARLADEGYEPRGALRATFGHSQIIWERAPRSRDRQRSEWRVIEFGKSDDLEAALVAAGKDGFEPRVLARPALRSWPGLSEKGLLLAARTPQAPPREVRVVRASSKKVDEAAREVDALSSDGWSFDLMFTTSRDGSRELQRQRAYLVFSRGAGDRAPRVPLRLTRSSSWGMLASGEPIAAGLYFDDFLVLWRPDERRQVWGSPTQLSRSEADCGGLSLKLRFDGDHEQRSTIVAVVARQTDSDGRFELVMFVDERFGF